MAGTLLVPPSGIPLERLVHMAVERGYTAQGEMFSGELGASLAFFSRNGLERLGETLPHPVYGRVFFQSSGPSPHPVLQGRLWSKAVWVPSPILPLPTMGPWTLTLSMLLMVTGRLRGIGPQEPLDTVRSTE